MKLARNEDAVLRALRSCAGAPLVLLMLACSLSAQVAETRDWARKIGTLPPLISLRPKLDRADPTRANLQSGSLTPKDRFDFYAKTTFGPISLPGTLFGAFWGHWRNDPPEWKPDASGFGRRFASGYGRNIISNTIQFGVAAAVKTDPRYRPSGEHSIWRRTKYAVAYSFVTHKVDGGVTFDFARVAGSYGAAYASNLWYPEYETDVDDTLYRGTTAFLSGVAGNLLREFVPDLTRRVLHRHH